MYIIFEMPKLIDTTTLRSNLAEAMETATKDNFLVVLKNNRPHLALVDLDFFEDLLSSVHPQYLQSIKQARADLKAGRLFSHLEVFGDLN